MTAQHRAACESAGLGDTRQFASPPCGEAWPPGGAALDHGIVHPFTRLALRDRVSDEPGRGWRSGAQAARRTGIAIGPGLGRRAHLAHILEQLTPARNIAELWA